MPAKFARIILGTVPNSDIGGLFPFPRYPLRRQQCSLRQKLITLIGKLLLFAFVVLVGWAAYVALAVSSETAQVEDEVVGTISGDDTIFIATEGGREQRKLRERLRVIFGI